MTLNNIVKNILIFSAIMAIPFAVFAQEQRQKTVLCAATTEVINNLEGENFKEQLQWTGKSATGNSRYALWENSQGDWTLVQFNESVACILGTGVMSTFNQNSGKVHDKI